MEIKKYLRLLASFKLTIFCLTGSLILVFLGTMSQVSNGVYFAVKTYFQSFFVTTQIGNLQIPYFPGGYFFAILILLNLVGAYTFYFKINRQKIAIFLLHFGLVLFFFGEIINVLFTDEGQMAIKVGSAKNYSEIFRQVELVVIDKSNPDYDQFTNIPEKKIRQGRLIATNSIPFKLKIKKTYANAKLTLKKNNNTIDHTADQGVGTTLFIEPLPKSNNDNQINDFTALVEVVDNEKSLGIWLLSNAISRTQTINYNERKYEFLIRPKRNIYPFSIQLTDFKREMYPGTNIPKSFQSNVKVYNDQGEFDRQTSIFMNNPLYYQGKTFYQASFGDNDTVSIFQVVDNPGWLLPYIASCLVGAGMLLQFILRFYRFQGRKK